MFFLHNIITVAVPKWLGRPFFFNYKF